MKSNELSYLLLKMTPCACKGPSRPKEQQSSGLYTTASRYHNRDRMSSSITVPFPLLHPYLIDTQRRVSSNQIASKPSPHSSCTGRPAHQTAYSRRGARTLKRGFPDAISATVENGRNYMQGINQRQKTPSPMQHYQKWKHECVYCFMSVCTRLP